MVDLKGKGAVVTGGASGLGLAIAKEFIACGAQVLIADYNPKVEEIAKEIGAIGVVCDVSKEEDIKNTMDKTAAEFAHVDVAVASAGIGGAMNDIANETLDNWNLVNGIDYTGVMLTDKYAIQHMLNQGNGGAVINIASMFGMVAVPNNIAYSGSKGGVVNMTRAAGTHYAPQGIRVNAVCPGVIVTPLISEEAKEQYRNLHPAHRLGAVEEVAKLVAFLASDEATFITGAVIPIDGGYTAV